MPKTTSLAVVMDQIAKIKFAKDSTLAMLLAAAGRGWQLTYFEQSDLYLRDGVAYGRGSPLRVFANPEKWFELGEPALCCSGRVAGERDEEALACLVWPLCRRPLEDLVVQAIGFVSVCRRRGDPGEVDTCLGCDPRRLGCLGCRERLLLELLGLAQIAVRESDRS